VCRDVGALIRGGHREGLRLPRRSEAGGRAEGAWGTVAIVARTPTAPITAERAERGSGGDVQGSAPWAGDKYVGARFIGLKGRYRLYRAGRRRARVCPHNGMKRRRLDRARAVRHAEASGRNVKIGRGGIRRGRSCLVQELTAPLQAAPIHLDEAQPQLAEALFRQDERGRTSRPISARRRSHPSSSNAGRSSTGCRPQSSRPTR